MSIPERITNDYIESLNELFKQSSSDFSGALEFLFKMADTAFQNYQLDLQSLKQGIVYVFGVTGGGKSTLLNLLAGKKLKVVLDDKGNPALELQNKSDGVASIDEGNGKSNTLYPNIIRSDIIGGTIVDNPGDSFSNGIAQQILNNYFKIRLRRYVRRIKFLFVLPYEILTQNQGTGFIQEVNQLEKKLLEPQAIDPRYLAFVFTKVPLQYKFTPQQVLQEVMSVFQKKQAMLTDTGKFLLRHIKRVGLLFAPKKAHLGLIGRVYDDQQLIPQLIRSLKYYQNGSQILALGTSWAGKVRQLIRSCEMNYNKRIIKTIRQTFLSKTRKLIPFGQLKRVLMVIEKYEIIKKTEIQVSKLKAFYSQIGMSQQQIELQLRQITLLNSSIKNQQFSIKYGDITKEYNQLGIEDFFATKTSIRPQSVNGMYIQVQDGVNFQIQKTNLQNTVIEIKSLYQIILRDANPLQSIPSQVVGRNQLAKVTILAPVWHLATSFNLELKGSKGKTMYRSFQSEQGRMGGDFMGIAFQVSSDSNCELRIASIGGDGGTGSPKFLVSNGGSPGIHPDFDPPESFVVGDGGRPGDPGTVQLVVIKKQNNLKIRAEQLQGKRGLSGNFHNPKDKVQEPQVPTDTIKNLRNYDPIIRYENFLKQFFKNRSLQGQVAFDVFTKYVGQDFSKMGGWKFSKMKIQHLIAESKMICQIYTTFMYSKDSYFTNDQLFTLIQNFKEKLTGFSRQQYFGLDQVQQKALLKIIANILLIEQSLEKAFVMVNFDYLNYFYEKKTLQYENILKEQKQYQYQNQKQKKQTEFTKRIQQKIRQAQSITNQVQYQIQKISKKTDEKIESLKKELETAYQKKKQYVQQLKRQAPLKVVSGFLKFFGKVAGLFGPKGKVVGAGLQAGAGVLDSLITPPQPVTGKDLNPTTFLNMDNGLNSLLLAQAFDDLRPIDINSQIPSIKEIQSDVELFGGVLKYVRIVDNIAGALNKQLQNLDLSSSQSQPQKNKKRGENYQKKQKVSKASAAIQAFGVAQQGLSLVRNTMQTLNDIDKATKQTEEFRKQKEQLNAFMDKTLKGFMSKMGSVNTVFSKSGSQAKVYFLEYGFTQTLKDMQHFLKQALGGFESAQKADLFYILNKFEAALQTLSKIYSSIDNYRSQGQLGNLIITASKEDYRLEQRYPGFYDIQANLKKLVVLKQGNDILNSIKQSAFPSQPYYSYSNYRQLLKRDNKGLEKDWSVDNLMLTLKDAYNKHILSKTVIENGGGNQSVIIQRDNMSFASFDGADSIRFYLKGQPIVFFADVRISPAQRDALKFREINVKLELKPSKKQIPKEIKSKFQELEKTLNVNFGNEMSSSGNYYYRYNGVFYNLPSAQLEFVRSYDHDDKKNRFGNKLYEKVAKGQPMFSPYTTWKLKLKRETNVKIEFDSLLQKCIDYMQLTFYGSGVYIDTEALGGKALKLIKTHECYNAFETQVFDYIPLQG